MFNFSDRSFAQAMHAGISAGEAFSVRVPNGGLTGDVVLPLNKLQQARVGRGLSNGRGVKLNFNKMQVRKMTRGGFLPLIAAAIAAAIPGAANAMTVAAPELMKGFQNFVKFFKGEGISGGTLDGDVVGGIIPIIVGSLAASIPGLLKKVPEMEAKFLDAYKQIGHFFTGKGIVDPAIRSYLEGSGLVNFSGEGLRNFSGDGLVNFSGEGLVNFSGAGALKPKKAKQKVILTPEIAIGEGGAADVTSIGKVTGTGCGCKKKR